VSLGRWKDTLAFVAPPVLLLACSAFLLWNTVEEDAFIYFRVADNLASGHGYVFNAGGERIETGSSPIWQLLLVVPRLLHLNPITSAKLLGLLSALACVVLVRAIAFRLTRSKAASLVSSLLLAINVPFVWWSISGMEVPLYAAGLLACVYVLLEERSLKLWCALVALVSIMRPESWVAVPALVVPLYATHWRTSYARPALITAALALAGATTVRLLYFHDVFASPFYAKFGVDEDFARLRAQAYFMSSREGLAHALVLLALGARPFWRQRAVVSIVALCVPLLAWAMLVNDFKLYFRFLVPALPLLFVLVAPAICTLIAGPSGRQRQRWVAALSIALFAAVLSDNRAPGGPESAGNPLHAMFFELVRRPFSFTRDVATKLVDPDTELAIDVALKRTTKHTIYTNYQVAVGRFVRANYPPGSVIAYDQMGQTPWYAGSDRSFIDTLGLTNRYTGIYYFGLRAASSQTLRLWQDIAGKPLLMLGDLDREVDAAEVATYIFAQRPQVIMLHSMVAGIAGTIPALLASDPRLSEHYVLRCRVEGWVSVHERNDVARTKPLMAPVGVRVDVL